MKKRDRKKVIEMSLLENPDMETQVNDNIGKLILKIVTISVLLCLLIFGYSIKFSVNNYPQIFSTKFVGTFDASNFYDAKNCDLIIVEQYDSVKDLKRGDIVCYSNNKEKGSGVLLRVESNIIEIETAQNEIKRLSKTSIEGKQKKTIAVLGCFVEFIGSYYGIVFVNILLIAYLSFLTFSRINYENTKQGVMLLKKFKIQRKEEKRRLRLNKKLKGVENINYLVVSILENDFLKNKENFDLFNNNLKSTLKDKYKYILKCIHDSYLPAAEVSREERRHVTSLVELLFVGKSLDNDIEYMIIDLLLKIKVLDFESKHFVKEAKEFLSGELDDDDMLCFGSILYILLYKNRRIHDEYMKELAKYFLQKTQELDNKYNKILEGTAKTIVEMVK